MKIVKIDPHVHTCFSGDSLVSIEDVARVYKDSGIIVAVTDHNTTDAWGHLRMKKIPFIAGEEIDTGEGEVIGLFLSDQIPRGLGFNETVDRIREQGGIVYCPHPFDPFRKGVGDEEKVSRCDVVEVFNSRTLFRMFDEKAAKVADAYHKPRCVGSDAHLPSEIGNSCLVFDESHVFDESPSLVCTDPKRFLKTLSRATFYTRKTSLFSRFAPTIVKMYNVLRRARGCVSHEAPRGW